MSVKRRILLLILGTFVILDGLAWAATYRVVTAPSPEELQLAAAITPALSASAVEPKGDNLQQTVSLNGPWRYRQTGSETADYFSFAWDVSDWRMMEVPQNWYLAGLNYHGVVWFRREFHRRSRGSGRVDRNPVGAGTWPDRICPGGYAPPNAHSVAGHQNHNKDYDQEQFGFHGRAPYGLAPGSRRLLRSPESNKNGPSP